MPEGDPGREKYQWSEKDFFAKYQEEGAKTSTRLQPPLPLSIHQGLHQAGRLRESRPWSLMCSLGNRGGAVGAESPPL